MAAALGLTGAAAGEQVTSNLTPIFGGAYHLAETPVSSGALTVRTTAQTPLAGLYAGQGDIHVPPEVPPVFAPADTGSGPGNKFNLSGQVNLTEWYAVTDADVAGSKTAVLDIGIGRKNHLAPDDNRLDGFGLLIWASSEFDNGSVFFQFTEETSFQADSPLGVFELPAGTSRIDELWLNFEIDYWRDQTLTNGDFGRYTARLWPSGPDGSMWNAAAPTFFLPDQQAAAWDDQDRRLTLSGTYGDDWSDQPGYGGVFVNSVIYDRVDDSNRFGYEVVDLTYTGDTYLPEPGAMTLVLGGALALLTRRR